jgi:hypothetical protein
MSEYVVPDSLLSFAVTYIKLAQLKFVNPNAYEQELMAMEAAVATEKTFKLVKLLVDALRNNELPLLKPQAHRIIAD